VFVVFDGMKLLDVAGPAEVFSEANHFGASYRVVMASVDGQDVVTSVGTRMAVATSIGSVKSADTAVVSGGDDLVGRPIDPRLVDAVADLRPRVRRMASICTGSFILAQTGMLDGRRATTHWRHTGTLARRFPGVTVDEDAIYVRDGPILTSAGVTAGIDLALAMVEEDGSDELAHQVARDLVVFMRRLGAQPRLSVPARTARPRRQPLRTLCDQIAADPAADHSLTALAARSGLSVRHLSRLFRDDVGCTPAVYVNTVRLEAATALLRSGETRATAARRSGLGSEETLRRALLRGAAEFTGRR